jgi:hypothetical protein
MNDSSIGVEDYSQWSYFKKKNKPVMVDHSSRFCETILEKTKHHLDYDMGLSLVRSILIYGYRFVYGL